MINVSNDSLEKMGFYLRLGLIGVIFFEIVASQGNKLYEIWALGILAFGLMVSGLGLWWYQKKRVYIFDNLKIRIGEIVSISALVYLTGGLGSPLCLLYYVYFIFSSLIRGKQEGHFVALMSMSLYTTIYLAELGQKGFEGLLNFGWWTSFNVYIFYVAVMVLLDLFFNRFKERLDCIMQEKAALDAVGYVDCLTQLPNRKAFLQNIQNEMDLAKRMMGQFSCAILDIDNFALYNKIYGHHEGDFVLKKTSEILSAACRPKDHLFRYGPDEFGLIMVSTGRDKALQILENLRKELSLHTGSGIFAHPVTFSAGVATFPKHANHVETLLFVAEVALDKAKDHGKDSIEAIL